jgi:hypothetical protein
MDSTFTWSLEFVHNLVAWVFIGGISILCIGKNIIDYLDERKEKKQSK